MRVPLLSAAALTFILAASVLHADPAGEIVVCLASRPPGADDDRAAFVRRIAPLGLVPRASLADRLPAAGQAADPGPFDLDPARILLFAAGDSAAADRAALALSLDPAVEWLEPNRPRESAVLRPEPAVPPGPAIARVAADFPDDPLFRDSRQWGLRNLGAAGAYGGLAGADIHALEAWRRSTGATDLRLAIADTGIDPAHPDLAARLPGGSARIERGINVTAEASRSFADSLGHGTAVAGVMAALSGDGAHLDSLGVAGVCGGDGAGNLGCRIVPIKIAPGHSRYATSFDIASAMLYATAVGARALNLSFAGGGPSRLERLALYHALTHGCVVVAASGNRGYQAPRAPQYPAAYAADGLCIQVGASDPFDRRAVFSSHGPGLDLVAPGQDIWSTGITYELFAGGPQKGYVAGSGTSFAAPFVTGAVGLLAAARPDLADVDFQRLLRESADDLGVPGVDEETGWGRLNAAAALAAVGPECGVWHDEVAPGAFRVLATDTLALGEDGPGVWNGGLAGRRATLVEVRATVALPDSFADSVRVWPRVGGTFTVRPGFRLPYFAPWAEVVERRGRTFTLRGYLYRLEDGAPPQDPGSLWVPLPPDQVRFGFTVLGRVVRREPPTGRARFFAHPNPFRDRTGIVGPPGRVTIVDLAGRVMYRGVSDGAGRGFEWDGRGPDGRKVPSGIYFVRCAAEGGTASGRVVRIE